MGYVPNICDFLLPYDLPISKLLVDVKKRAMCAEFRRKAQRRDGHDSQNPQDSEKCNMRPLDERRTLLTCLPHAVNVKSILLTTLGIEARNSIAEPEWSITAKSVVATTA